MRAHILWKKFPSRLTNTPIAFVSLDAPHLTLVDRARGPSRVHLGQPPRQLAGQSCVSVKRKEEGSAETKHNEAGRLRTRHDVESSVSAEQRFVSCTLRCNREHLMVRMRVVRHETTSRQTKRQPGDSPRQTPKTYGFAVLNTAVFRVFRVPHGMMQLEGKLEGHFSSYQSGCSRRIFGLNGCVGRVNKEIFYGTTCVYL